MIRYDPTLMDLPSNFFVLCTNMKAYIFNKSQWVELSMNIHEKKGKYGNLIPLSESIQVRIHLRNLLTHILLFWHFLEIFNFKNISEYIRTIISSNT